MQATNHRGIELPTATARIRGKRCQAAVGVAVGSVGVLADCSVGVTARVISTRIISEQRL